MSLLIVNVREGTEGTVHVVYRKGGLRAPTPLPADVQALLDLDPDIYLDLRHASLPGVGQVLFHDSAGTVPVSEPDEAIGWVRNLGSLGGAASSSGTMRPLFKGPLGGQFDGLDDVLRIFASDGSDTHSFVIYYTQDVTYGSNENRNLTDTAQTSAMGMLIRSVLAPGERRWLPTGSSAEGAIGSSIDFSEHGPARLIYQHSVLGASFALTGAVTDSGSTTGDRRRTPDGLSVGSIRQGAAAAPSAVTVRAVARYPRVLTAPEIDTLPSLL